MKSVNDEKPVSRWKPYWFLLKIFLIAIIVIFVVSEFTLAYLVPLNGMANVPIEGEIAWRFAVLFTAVSIPVIYFGNSLLAGGLLKINYQRLILYVGLIMFLGNALELLIDEIFLALIDRPSWVYHIWPKFNGASSGITAIMWPLYGFHLLCFDTAMTKKKSLLVSSIPVKGIMIGIDAMVMEMIANVFSLSLFHAYYFFYISDELNHFTTLEIFIPYVIVGFIVMTILHYIDKPRFPRIIIGLLGLIVGWTVLYNG